MRTRRGRLETAGETNLCDNRTLGKLRFGDEGISPERAAGLVTLRGASLTDVVLVVGDAIPVPQQLFPGMTHIPTEWKTLVRFLHFTCSTAA